MSISKDNFFKNFILGVTSECLQIDTRQQNFDAILKLVDSAQNNVSIVSRNLDAKIFNREEFSIAASQMARRNRTSYIHILVHNPSNIVNHCTRFLELSQRIPSKIEIRTICDEYNQFNRSFLVADAIGYIHNPKSDLYDAEVNLNDKEKSTELMETFKSIWEASAQDTSIRRLCI